MLLSSLKEELGFAKEESTVIAANENRDLLNIAKELDEIYTLELDVAKESAEIELIAGVAKVMDSAVMAAEMSGNESNEPVALDIKRIDGALAVVGLDADTVLGGFVGFEASDEESKIEKAKEAVKNFMKTIVIKLKKLWEALKNLVAKIVNFFLGRKTLKEAAGRIKELAESVKGKKLTKEDMDEEDAIKIVNAIPATLTNLPNEGIETKIEVTQSEVKLELVTKMLESQLSDVKNIINKIKELANVNTSNLDTTSVEIKGYAGFTETKAYNFNVKITKDEQISEVKPEELKKYVENVKKAKVLTLENMIVLANSIETLSKSVEKEMKNFNKEVDSIYKNIESKIKNVEEGAKEELKLLEAINGKALPILVKVVNELFKSINTTSTYKYAELSTKYYKKEESK